MPSDREMRLLIPRVRVYGSKGSFTLSDGECVGYYRSVWTDPKLFARNREESDVSLIQVVVFSSCFVELVQFHWWLYMYFQQHMDLIWSDNRTIFCPFEVKLLLLLFSFDVNKAFVTSLTFTGFRVSLEVVKLLKVNGVLQFVKWLELEWVMEFLHAIPLQFPDYSLSNKNVNIRQLIYPVVEFCTRSSRIKQI